MQKDTFKTMGSNSQVTGSPNNVSRLAMNYRTYTYMEWEGIITVTLFLDNPALGPSRTTWSFKLFSSAFLCN